MLLRLCKPILRARCISVSSVFFSDKFVRNKRHLNVGMIGHQTHGKTTLTSAITKFLSKKGLSRFYKMHDLIKTPEERAKGFTINNATVEYETEKCHYCHVDSPGRPDYGKNTIIGSSRMDIGILVVDNEGIQTQTREHIILAKQLGVSDIVIYMNKADLVHDRDDLEYISLEVKDLLTKYGFNGESAKVVIGSALSVLEDKNPKMGEGSIRELLEAVESVQLPPRDTKSPFLLQLDHLTTVTVSLAETR